MVTYNDWLNLVVEEKEGLVYPLSFINPPSDLKREKANPEQIGHKRC